VQKQNSRLPLSRLVWLLVLAWLVAGATAVAAQDPPETDDDEVAAEGAADSEEVSDLPRFADTLDVVEAQAERTETATTMGRSDLETRRVSVAYDALDKMPGLHLRSRLGATGAGLPRPVLRGKGATGPAGLAVSVGGRPDSTVSFAHPAPSAHSLDAIETIEVIHGPSPVLHGAGKTGVINITTPRPGLGWQNSLRVSGGSYSTIESFLSSGYGWEGGFLRVGGTYRDTDGHNPESDARIAAGNFRLGFDLNERWGLELGAGRTDDHFSVFGPFFVPGPFGNPGTEDIDLVQTVADVELGGVFEDSSFSAQLWYDDLDPTSQVLRPGVNRGDVSESGLRMRASLFEDRPTSLIVGLDVLDAEATNTPGVPPGRPEQEESLTEVGPYFFAEHRLSAQTELRGGIRIVDHSAYGTEPAAEVGVLRHFGDPSAMGGSSLRFRATHGYQSPTLQQLYGVFRGGPAGLANPDLAPEIVDQYEIGYSRRTASSELDIVAFLQDGSDLIQIVRGRLQNSGDFTHPGFEGRLSFTPSPGLTLNLGATWLDLEDSVLSIPAETADVGLLYRFDRWSRHAMLNVLARWTGGYEDRITPMAPVVELGSSFVVDLKFRVQAGESTHLFASIDNLTDEEYQTVAGIPMPGLSGFAGLSFDF